MCGICGFVSRREISNKTLKIMNDTTEGMIKKEKLALGAPTEGG